MRMKISGYIEVPADRPDPYKYAAQAAKELSSAGIEGLTVEPAKPEKPKKDSKDRHPSYGVIRISRGTGAQRPLFGSSIAHSNTITIQIHEASLERSLCSDTIMPEGLIAELEMSQSQFADLITSMNIGGGSPCTIKYLRGKGTIKPCPFVDKKTQFESELSENMDKANEKANALINEISAMFASGKTLAKKDKEKISSMLHHLFNEINANRKFVYSSFNEQMDNTVHEAKGEIEAFMQNRILRSVGIKLNDSSSCLIDIESPEIESPESLADDKKGN